MIYQPMSLWRHWRNRWSQLGVRAFPPVHRAYDQRDEPLHRARWSLTGPDIIVENPWWNSRWQMEARSCDVFGWLR